MLKCLCLTNIVNVWKDEFDMTEICFLQCLCKAESLYRTDVNLMWVQCKKVTEKVMEVRCCFVENDISLDGRYLSLFQQRLYGYSLSFVVDNIDFFHFISKNLQKSFVI